jgi:molybdopterin converting factor small subunit
MTVKIKLHQYYQEMAGGKEVVEAEGSTIAELFDDLEKRYPGIKEHLVDKRGKLQGFVEVFVNSEIVYPERTGDRVKDGDEVEILTIVAGG